MSAFHNVLVAADFSEGSRAAFATACPLARARGARVTVVHVREPGPMPPGGPEALLGRLRAAYVPGSPVEAEYLVREGEPAAGVLAAAGELGSDLVVMGTHGRTGLDRLLTGSVAETVLRHAHCPVLALRSGEGAGTGVGPVRTILHPTDFSDGPGLALRTARDLARDHGARLVLLHVVPTIDVPHLDGPATAEDPQECREALAAVCRVLDDADLKYPVSARLALGDPTDEIVRAAVEIGADLVVMGTHGRTGLSRLLMGSVAEQVLRRARCPVLLTRAAAPVAARV